MEERNRLSRDMHDSLAQALSIIKWKAQLLGKTITSGNKMQSLNELNEITEMLAATQHEAKAVIDQLHTTIKSDQGFVPTLAQYATDFTRQYGIKCELYVADGLVKLSSLAELEMLCVAQEALNNTRKHAEATAVVIRLESEGNRMKMTVSDNGKGFKMPREIGNLPSSGRLGLVGIYERARLLDGTLEVHSSPGEGTEILVRLPIEGS